MRIVLEDQGYSVSSANDGEDGMEQIKASVPDLIILDHRMPIRNGLETAMEILSMDPDEKIIFISADSSVKEKALEIGVIDFLEKPFMLNKLKEAIDVILKQ